MLGRVDLERKNDMLKTGQYGIQFLMGDTWKWLFCYNPARGLIATVDPHKALGKYDLDYFKSHYGNTEFRLTKIGAIK